MKKILALVISTIFLFACSSDESSTSPLTQTTHSSNSNNSESTSFHIITKYVIGIDLNTQELAYQAVVAKCDMDFQKDNTLKICLSMAGTSSCGDMIYTVEIDEEDDVVYSWTNADGDLIEFYPHASGLEGEMLSILKYEEEFISFYVTSKKDADTVIKLLEEEMSEQ